MPGTGRNACLSCPEPSPPKDCYSCPGLALTSAGGPATYTQVPSFTQARLHRYVPSRAACSLGLSVYLSQSWLSWKKVFPERCLGKKGFLDKTSHNPNASNANLTVTITLAFFLGVPLCLFPEGFAPRWGFCPFTAFPSRNQ